MRCTILAATGVDRVDRADSVEGRILEYGTEPSGKISQAITVPKSSLPLPMEAPMGEKFIFKIRRDTINVRTNP